jgi:hypothetical protein
MIYANQLNKFHLIDYLISTYLGIITGFLYFFVFGFSKKCKTVPSIAPNFNLYILLCYKGMLFIKMNRKYYIHLHHYLIYGFMSVVLYLYCINLNIIAFCVIGFIHGCTYNDFSHFLETKSELEYYT